MQVLATPLHLPQQWDRLSFLASAFAWGLELSWVWFLCTMCQCSRASFAFRLLKCWPRYDSTDLSELLRRVDVSAEMLPLCNSRVRNVKNKGSSFPFPSSLGLVCENLWTSQSKAHLQLSLASDFQLCIIAESSTSSQQSPLSSSWLM